MSGAPFVSIIVPIYKVEKLLPRCVESLMRQSLSNIEIILVDDESPDRCGEIADEFAKRDNRIRVLHKKNGGLGSARNAGLEIASGEYVGFVDSDDWVEDDMFEKLYHSAKRHQADMTMGGFCRINERGDKRIQLDRLQRDVYEGKQVIEDILIPMIGSESKAEDDVSIEMGVCKNIYKHELLTLHQLRFQSEREYISEDLIFHIDVLSKARRVSVVQEPLYNYWLNTQSLSQSYRSDRFAKERFFYSAVIGKLKEVGLLSGWDERLRRTFIGRARVCIISEAKNNKQQSILQRLRNIKKIVKDDLLSEILRNYPIGNYAMKQRLVAYCMKYRLATLLFVASVLFHKRY